MNAPLQAIFLVLCISRPYCIPKSHNKDTMIVYVWFDFYMHQTLAPDKLKCWMQIKWLSFASPLNFLRFTICFFLVKKSEGTHISRGIFLIKFHTYQKQKKVIKEFPSVKKEHVLSMKETLIKNVHVYLIKKTPTWTICESSDILISI